MENRTVNHSPWATLLKWKVANTEKVRVPKSYDELACGVDYSYPGDIGYVDKDGYWYVVDRIKELIKVKGFQVRRRPLGKTRKQSQLRPH